MMEILPLLVIRINLMTTLEGLFCVLELELYYNLYICHFR